ncbi:MAG: hypothetical protein O2904_01735 [bacterium]|nr:hypothetical protein [bacterium]
MEYIPIALGCIILYFVARPRISGVNAEDNIRLRAELEQQTKEVGRLQQHWEEEKREKTEITGKAKELKEAHIALKAEHTAIANEKDHLYKQIAHFEAQQIQREAEQKNALNEFKEAKNSLEDEKRRVRREDEERQQSIMEERDRQWNEHEISVASLLRDLCKKREFQFDGFDNTNLPNGFDGSFKPDFLIEFLGQYIIFDAKVSRSDNFQNYVTTQVKSTVKKAKSRSDIYPAIFLVVPTEAISLLKETIFHEQDFTVYVVSPESLAPILAGLKKITTYELTEQFDPQERENIINLVANLDFHIHQRNATDILMSKFGAELIRDSQRLYPELSKEVIAKKQNMRVPNNLKPTELKRLTANVDAQVEEIEELESPKATISSTDMKSAELLLEEKL